MSTTPQKRPFGPRLLPGTRLASTRLQAGRGSALDEILAVVAFMAIPIEFPVFELGRYPMLAIILALFAFSWRETLPMLRRGWYFFLLPAFCLLSVLWSNFAYETIRFAGYMALALMVALYLATRLSHRQIVVAVMLAKLIIALLSFAFLEMTYVGGIGGGWATLGLYPHKNVLGAHTVVMMIAALAILLDGRYRQIWRLVALPTLVIGVFYVFNARSATAILLMLSGCLSISTLGGIWRPAAQIRGLRILLVSGAVLLMCGGALIFMSTQDTDLYGFVLEKLNKDTTLTGRTMIWEQARQLVEANPWLGVGADAFWRPGVGDASKIVGMFTESSSNAFNFHNAYFEVTVHIGYIGLVIWLFVILAGIRITLIDWLRHQTAVDGFFLTIIVLMLLRSQTESEMFNFPTLSMILFWTGVFLALRRQVFGTEESER